MSRAVASDTTVAIKRTVNGKKHRVFLTAPNRGQGRSDTRPIRVVRFVDDKLVDAMELVETRIGDRWVVTKGRVTFFDSTGRSEKATARFELSELQTASARTRIMLQSADVLLALGSAFLPTPLNAEDDTELEGLCAQMFLAATNLSAQATAATTVYMANQLVIATTSDPHAIIQEPILRQAMVDAIAIAATAWSAYRETCIRRPPPPTPDSTLSSSGGGDSGQVMCYFWIFYEIDTGNIVEVVPLGCW